MKRGPFPLAADKMTIETGLKPPVITPVFAGERVALRVSAGDNRKLSRGPGLKGIITDLDDGRRYALVGSPCSAGTHCYCDAEIRELEVE
jgi:hypothetical protein